MMAADSPPPRAATTHRQRLALRRTVAAVAALNIAYFAVEFAMARALGSVALFADSIDFLEDASVNALVLIAIGYTAGTRRAVGLGLALLLLVPSAAALWTAWNKLNNPSVPEWRALSATAAGALAVNAACATLLARVTAHGGSLSKAAFLSARNDVVANVAIIAAGLATAASPSIWPDFAVGIAIAGLNATAALEVASAALSETDRDASDRE